MMRPIVHGMMARWPRSVIELGFRLVKLPPVTKEGVPNPGRVWDFIYGLDDLRHNASAIKALANVADSITRRPTRDEVLVFAWRAIQARKALYKVMQDKERHGPMRMAKTPRFGFRRGVELGP